MTDPFNICHTSIWFWCLLCLSRVCFFLHLACLIIFCWKPDISYWAINRNWGMLAPSVRFYVDLLGSWAVFHVWSSNRCQGLWISLLFLFLTSLLNDGSPHMLCTQREFADFNSNSAAPSTFSLSGKATLSLQQCVKIVMEVFVTSAAPAPGKQMWLSIPWLQFSNESKKSHWLLVCSALSCHKKESDRFQGLSTSELKLEIS